MRGDFRRGVAGNESLRWPFGGKSAFFAGGGGSKGLVRRGFARGVGRNASQGEDLREGSLEMAKRAFSSRGVAKIAF